MSRFVVVVESDLRSGNLNYRVRRSDAMPQEQARELFDRVVRGAEPGLLREKPDALLVRVSDTQVCRFWTGATRNESMDRVTLAKVLDD